jgi:Ca2+-binding RTX toxin-like protein
MEMQMANVNGSNGADRLSGTEFDDVINGNSGDDIIRSSDGADHIDGGSGSDTMDYSRYDGELSIVLDNANPVTVLGNGQPGDVLVDIENLIGGRRDDFFAGDDSDNTFRGNGGNDYFVASSGFDHYYGGTGYDMVDYSKTGVGLFFNAAKNGVITVGGGIDHDTLKGIEQIIGTDFDDRILGTKANNEFYGGGGKDQLAGGAGGDVLSGQGGDDVLTGGKDADIFVFETGGGKDTVTDFKATGDDHDVLDMRNVASASSFDFMLHDHRIWQDGSNVMIDAGQGDEITLKNVDIHDLSASDFLI